MCDISNPIYHDETKAREWLEAELWPRGPVCPHCGTVGLATLLKGKTTRPGLYQCNACREPFTVTVGTLYERSHIPLHKWLMGTHLMMASKKGISSLQLHRMLGLTKKTAWFMAHRIRESLHHVSAPGDELGGNASRSRLTKPTSAARRATARTTFRPKQPVVALVERKGRVRSRHVPSVSGQTLRPILNEMVRKDTFIMTDESPAYPPIVGDFRGHGTVNHSAEEYVRGVFYHTNTVENYFSILKRGIIGVYHHLSPQHLGRYLAEFDFRYNQRMGLGVNDNQRMAASIPGIVGKRLTYRRPGERPQAQEGANA